MKWIICLSILAASNCYAAKVEIKNESFDKFNSLLSLELSSRLNDPATGFYTTNKNGELDGAFHIKADVSGYDKIMDTHYAFKKIVKGEYKAGKKNSLWLYEIVFDDGVDYFESYTINIKYKFGECLESNFEGIIGHIMPKTKHTFIDKELCTPTAIINKAQELWSIEFEKIK